MAALSRLASLQAHLLVFLDKYPKTLQELQQPRSLVRILATLAILNALRKVESMSMCVLTNTSCPETQLTYGALPPNFGTDDCHSVLSSTQPSPSRIPVHHIFLHRVRSPIRQKVRYLIRERLGNMPNLRRASHTHAHVISLNLCSHYFLPLVHKQHGKIARVGKLHVRKLMCIWKHCGHILTPIPMLVLLT